MLKAIAAWQIWTLSRVAIAVLLAVELLAVLIPGTDSAQIAPSDLGTAVLLASLSIAYSAFTVTWERVRVLITSNQTPNMCPNLLATWTFAAGIMLPMRLAALVVVVTAIADWRARNLAGLTSLHRYVYSSAGVVLAAIAAGALRDLQLSLLLTLPAACIAYEAVQAVLVSLAMASTGQISSVKTLWDPRTYVLELCTVSIGVAEAMASWHRIPLIWLSLPLAIGIQRWSRKEALRALDDSPAPLSEQVWSHVARGLVAGCELAALIRIDTHDPAAVRAMAQVQSGCDIMGSVGDGSGLAILLADCPAPYANALAARLRAAVSLANVTAHVAVAAKPDDGSCLEDLLVVAEAELIATVAGIDVQNQHRST